MIGDGLRVRLNRTETLNGSKELWNKMSEQKEPLYSGRGENLVVRYETEDRRIEALNASI
jgi:hypothetical protein